MWITSDSTSIDRARMTLVSSIDKPRMIPTSFIAIDYEKYLLVRVLWDQGIREFLLKQSADEVTLEVDIFSRVGYILSISRISNIGCISGVGCWSEGGGIFALSLIHDFVELFG